MTVLACDRSRPQQYADETGQRFWSVTEVRHVMDPPSPWWTEEARQRGHRLHVYFALALAAVNGLGEMPDEVTGLDGYCQGIRAWVETERPEVVRLEEPSCNRQLRIAGTPDALVLLGPRKVLTLLDLKTGQPTRTDHAQLLAYRTFEGYSAARAMVDLYVRPDGPPRVLARGPDPHSWAAFLSAVNLLQWRTT